MSTETSIGGVTEDGRTGTLEELEDSGETPRVEAPVAVKVSTPSTVMAESARERTSMVVDGYFTARPAASELQRHLVVSSSDPSSPNAVDVVSPAQSPAPESATSNTLHRPSAHSTHSNLSNQSTDSTSTITAVSSAPVLTPSGRPRPDFPNQAYSALQSQKYPVSRATPHQTLKQRGTHPGQIFTFTSALASRHQPGPRTVGSSAPVTPAPGLFNPQRQPISAEWESVATSGTYASPFLHFTQRTQPKETYVADVDVDPISGRKLINHYEIIDELGRGTHGKVKLGRDLTNGTHVAIKIVDRFSKRRKLGKLGTTEDKVKKEVAILKQVRHPNVTALLEVIDDPTRKKVYLVLEWVELGQIQWRVKGAKEVVTVEARRYERERSGITNKQLEAEDVAILGEAQKRLARQRRKHLRSFRKTRQDAPSEIWSMETAGDDESGTSDDDKLSRVSTESYGSILVHADGRRSSRTPSPLPPLPNETGVASSDRSASYLPLTNELQTHSPSTLTNVYTGLEGTMYGPYHSYIPGHGDQSRGSSMHSLDSARRRTMTNPESLSRVASEILDSELNDELGYVPVLTIQQIRVAFRDTVIGLQYLHYQGIIHRDIKPPNLLETKEHRVKISDFGVSYLGRSKGENEALEDVSEHETQDLDDGAKELAKTVGTPAFYAPELCITEATDDAPPITGAIDVWALGITLFCMLFARTPFVDNEFVVMRQIAEEEIYIPRSRLKPVEPKSRARPQSQRHAYPPLPADRRDALELSYEDLSEELYDLLRRMLVKDPRKRIKLEEIRHHAWVVADIPDKVKWLEETDTSRQSQGKKIEVSKEDVNAAVVPLQFLDRVRTTIKNFGERLGFGGKPASRGRQRSSVGGGIETSPSPSSASGSTNMSHEGQRSSVRGEETMLSPLKSPHAVEHPLSRSVNTSPEQDAKTLNHSAGPRSAISPVPEQVSAEMTDSLLPPSDPTSAVSDNSSKSTSMRTVRQSDFHVGHNDASPPVSPGRSRTPVAFESPGNNTSGTSSGRVSRILQSVRERSLARSADGRAASSDRASLASIDTHGEPSLAVSQANATGQINSPTVSGEFTPTSPMSSTRNSPSTSGPFSPIGDRLLPSAEAGDFSRTSSNRSISSLGRVAPTFNRSVSPVPANLQPRFPADSGEDEWQRAENEHIRKRLQEEVQEKEPASPFDDRRCPPSPDDQRETLPDSRRMSTLDIWNPSSSQEASPTGQGALLPAAMASSTSDFGSSASMSNPSIQSVISEASSMALSDSMAPREMAKQPTDLLSSDDTVYPEAGSQPGEHDVHLSNFPEEAFSNGHDSDNEFDDSSDSDGGLVMSRRKSAAKQGQERNNGLHSHSHSTSSKSSRRGSDNTMKKTSPRDSTDEQQQLQTGEERS